MERFAQLAEAVGATSKKTEKVRLVSEYLKSVPVETAALAAQYLSGRPLAAWEERTLQVGGALLWGALREVSSASDAAMTAAMRKHGDLGSAAREVLEDGPQSKVKAELTLPELREGFEALIAAKGAFAKGQVLRTLLARTTPVEAKYVIKIITGEMRIGLKESLVEEAIAKTFDTPLVEVKRANMLLGDIAETLRKASESKLDDARMRLFHPIGFMLATPAESAEEAFDEFDDALIEDKYDGIRAQVHVGRSSEGERRVRIYSRTLDEISESFPELVPALEGFSDEVILDGEILAWRSGRALAFSQLQQRLGRKRVTERMQSEVPVAYMGFDILAQNGELLIDEPLTTRRARLREVYSRLQPPEAHMQGQGLLAFQIADDVVEPRVLLAPSAEASSSAHLDELFEAAQDRGNEGLMIKDRKSAYTPGRRGRSWLKLKRELATLDVVVTGVEFGNGKRAGVLSDYTFAIRSGDQLLNVGKAYTGLTDVEIAEMNDWFKQHTLEDLGHFRTVEPKIVIEVAFNAVMVSDRHASGFALRFPRIVRLRPDKPVAEIDTLERVEQVYRSQIHLRKSA